MQVSLRANRWYIRGVALFLTGLIVFLPLQIGAQEGAAWQAADAVQKAMNSAQLALFGGDQAGAATIIAEASQTYATSLAPLAQELRLPPPEPVPMHSNRPPRRSQTTTIPRSRQPVARYKPRCIV